MANPTLEDIQQDGLTMAVARALRIANERAVSEGTDLAQSLVTITEESPPPERLWRIHYGPREYVHRRGGDLILLIDEQAGIVRRVLRGQ